MIRIGPRSIALSGWILFSVLFAVLLPWTTGVTLMEGLDADDQVLASRASRNPPSLT